ncbi:hypothetical protein [Mycolicibacter sinensis]|jgi:hypothetical protein|nr:hypothetical protein [Mycolicibacter sinensis]
MPKKYGVKEKDLVVNHIVDLVSAGEPDAGQPLSPWRIRQPIR